MSIRSSLLRNLVIAAIALVVTAITVAVVWSQLPDPVAIHWGPSGEADGFAARGPGLLAILFGLPLVTGAVLLAVTVAVPRSAPGASVLQGLPAGLTWFVLAVVGITTVSQAGTSATAPPDLQGWWLGLAILAGVVGTAVTAWLAPPPDPLPARQGGPDAAAPRLSGGAAGDLWWTGAAPTSTTMVVMAVAQVAIGLVLAWLVDAWMLALFLPIALLLVASSRAHVTIGREMVLVSGGLAGWPRLRVPLQSVTQADATTTGIWEWGGWGLRVRPGATGVITRAGEALQLHRTDDTRVVITLEGADTAAAVVNTLLERP